MPSDALPEDQMLLGLEDVEQTAASNAAGAEQAAPAARQAGAAKRRANRGVLPGSYVVPWELLGLQAQHWPAR